MNNTHSILIVAVVSVVTILLRFIPFLLLRNRETPKYITYLGTVLPYAIMGMLVVYCLKSMSIVSYPFGLPELCGCLTVVLVHVWKRNTLLSILLGTVVYMVCVQAIF